MTRCSSATCNAKPLNPVQADEIKIAFKLHLCYNVIRSIDCVGFGGFGQTVFGATQTLRPTRFFLNSKILHAGSGADGKKLDIGAK